MTLGVYIFIVSVMDVSWRVILSWVMYSLYLLIIVVIVVAVMIIISITAYHLCQA